MSRRMLAFTALLALAVACSEQATPPTVPAIPGSPPAPTPSSGDLPPEQAALEGLAREIALAMGREEFRHRVRQQLETSPFREHKVHLQETLLGNAAALRTAVGEESRATRMVALASGAVPAEVYFPVEAHRRSWDGSERLLVATAMDDHDPPVAFDTKGRRYVLDAFTPPATPVLALVPRETPILRRVSAKCLSEDCVQPQGGGGGTAGGGGGAGGPSLSAGSLTLTHAEFTEDFEGWLKGKPEFELHVLGPLSPADTATLTSYQCVGEHAPAPYAWDMNTLSWDGAVKVFTYEQMDAFQTAYPDRAFVIMALEYLGVALIWLFVNCTVPIEPEESR